MFCKICTHDHVSSSCPSCGGTGVEGGVKFLKECRQDPNYKVGYLRSAIKHIIMMLEHGDPDGAKLHAEDTLRTITVESDTL